HGYRRPGPTPPRSPLSTPARPPAPRAPERPAAPPLPHPRGPRARARRPQPPALRLGPDTHSRRCAGRRRRPPDTTVAGAHAQPTPPAARTPATHTPGPVARSPTLLRRAPA